MNLEQWLGRHMSPQERVALVAEIRRIQRRRTYFDAVFGWMRRIPLVGIVMYVWWSSLVDEGLDGAVDAMCFSFLDDANPTASWHSWYRGES